MREIKIACQGATALPIEDFTEFQGELKSLSKEDYEKLRKEIRDNGFSFTVHVWRNDGKTYILDGHQRLRTVRKMIEEGYSCPPIPVSIVEAESYKQAKHKLLAAASQYGKVESQGLYEFLDVSQITPDELAASFRFADLDIPTFIDEHYKDIAGDPFDVSSLNEESSSTENDMRHASSHVRMVQLFFNDQNHPEFVEKTNALAELFGKDNLTDTILELVREAYQSRIQN